MMICAPFALMHFMPPWILLWRKLSEFDFIVSRYMPIVVDDFCRAETFRFHIGIELIEIRYTHRQIVVCQKLCSFLLPYIERDFIQTIVYPLGII